MCEYPLRVRVRQKQTFLQRKTKTKARDRNHVSQFISHPSLSVPLFDRAFPQSPPQRQRTYVSSVVVLLWAAERRLERGEGRREERGTESVTLT